MDVCSVSELHETHFNRLLSQKEQEILGLQDTLQSVKNRLAAELATLTQEREALRMEVEEARGLSRATTLNHRELEAETRVLQSELQKVQQENAKLTQQIREMEILHLDELEALKPRPVDPTAEVIDLQIENQLLSEQLRLLSIKPAICESSAQCLGGVAFEYTESECQTPFDEPSVIVDTPALAVQMDQTQQTETLNQHQDIQTESLESDWLNLQLSRSSILNTHQESQTIEMEDNQPTQLEVERDAALADLSTVQQERDSILGQLMSLRTLYQTSHESSPSNRRSTNENQSLTNLSDLWLSEDENLSVFTAKEEESQASVVLLSASESEAASPVKIKAKAQANSTSEPRDPSLASSDPPETEISRFMATFSKRETQMIEALQEAQRQIMDLKNLVTKPTASPSRSSSHKPEMGPNSWSDTDESLERIFRETDPTRRRRRQHLS